MEFTANQIASLAGGIVEGDGEVKISTIAKIEEGHPGAISFLSNPKYTHFIYTTKSSAVLVSNDFTPEQPISATLIRVADPYATVARLLKMVEDMLTPKFEGTEQPCFVASDVELPEGHYVGAFAYIGKGCKLGKNVKIFPQAYVGQGVEIGEGTIIYAGAKIYHGCKIGCNCIIHSGAVIGADGFGFAPTPSGYEKIPQIGNVVIADNVEIGANTTVDRAVMGSTRIEQGVKLDNLIQIAHNCVIGRNTAMASQAGVAGSTKVGENCLLGGQVGLAGHITVGNDVQIAAQSGIKESVESGARLFGSPAMDFKAYCRQAIYVKDLPALYKRVKELEKNLKK
ncbi:MAG: UDP-3-O-(3-hydroxymyristoyl)glucosamine N-acyltransferase [Firmicutes bacterium]|nr:UDP-3-O-(3-hydroxymyristoyl)glucosamine N-acyltransferase [Bacillota bacterium]MCM1401713.1 UDP-3-O-(3-hydroxymyristoyl)glucosamine N-acyltransferase [Bacteroides sp.]MCM1477742.1 UDP-3-O-(3-hydroxymyristoyl)glucosamine N-acyltransferase [Bacteroides sp.]